MNRALIVSCILLASLSSALFGSTAVAADVSPGDRIDKTNWSKAEGLLPEPVLDWVKKGEFVLDIGALEYDPGQYMPPYCLEATPKNEGRFDVDDMGNLFEKATGEYPDFMLGLPFPTISPDEPMAAAKYEWNQFLHRYSWGHLRYQLSVTWVNERGMERKVTGEYRSVVYNSCPAYQDLPNPELFETLDIASVQQPFDLAGTAIMTWRYKHDKPDGVFAYVPAIRRVRRLSPANRSDSFLGSDLCMDDIATYDGRVSAFEWKVIGTGEMLAPFPTAAPQRIVPDKGQWKSTEAVHGAEWGFETEGWQGAKWAVTNYIWVKRPVVIIEGVPRDPYYNYGRQIFYVDPEAHIGYYKIIYDRSGNHWKTLVVSYGGVESADKETMKMIHLYFHLIVDEKANHASVNEAVSARNTAYYLADNKLADYTLAGFQKFCK